MLRARAIMGLSQIKSSPFIFRIEFYTQPLVLFQPKARPKDFSNDLLVSSTILVYYIDTEMTQSLKKKISPMTKNANTIFNWAHKRMHAQIFWLDSLTNLGIRVHWYPSNAAVVLLCYLKSEYGIDWCKNFYGWESCVRPTCDRISALDSTIKPIRTQYCWVRTHLFFWNWFAMVANKKMHSQNFELGCLTYLVIRGPLIPWNAAVQVRELWDPPVITCMSLLKPNQWLILSGQDLFIFQAYRWTPCKFRRSRFMDRS